MYDASGLALWGNYAYVMFDDLGSLVIDVGDPTNCALVASYKPGTDA